MDARDYEFYSSYVTILDIESLDSTASAALLCYELSTPARQAPFSTVFSLSAVESLFIRPFISVRTVLACKALLQLTASPFAAMTRPARVWMTRYLLERRDESSNDPVIELEMARDSVIRRVRRIPSSETSIENAEYAVYTAFRWALILVDHLRYNRPLQISSFREETQFAQRARRMDQLTIVIAFAARHPHELRNTRVFEFIAAQAAAAADDYIAGLARAGICVVTAR